MLNVTPTGGTPTEVKLGHLLKLGQVCLALLPAYVNQSSFVTSVVWLASLFDSYCCNRLLAWLTDINLIGEVVLTLNTLWQSLLSVGRHRRNTRHDNIVCLDAWIRAPSRGTATISLISPAVCSHSEHSFDHAPIADRGGFDTLQVSMTSSQCSLHIHHQLRGESVRRGVVGSLLWTILGSAAYDLFQNIVPQSAHRWRVSQKWRWWWWWEGCCCCFRAAA